MKMEHKAFEVWEIEAIFTSDPQHPKWSRINRWCLTGWKEAVEIYPTLGGYHFGQFWNDTMCWDNGAVAKAAFDFLARRGQTRQMRLVHRVMTETRWVECESRATQPSKVPL